MAVTLQPVTRRSDLLRLGSEIGRVRVLKGLTKAALAEALGVHRVTVSRWESGERAVDGACIAKLERVLGVRVAFVDP